MMLSIPDEKKRQILAELRRYAGISEYTEGDLFIEDIMKDFGCGRETARALVNKLIEEGKFVRIRVSFGGRLRTVYRQVGSITDES